MNDMDTIVIKKINNFRKFDYNAHFAIPIKKVIRLLCNGFSVLRQHLIFILNSQEKIRTFGSALLMCSFSSGWMSGIIPALLSAASWTPGLFSLQVCNPVCVTFLQKSTLTSCRLPPWVTTACSTASVTRQQFSRHSRCSRLQLRSTLITSSSVMCPQPDRVRDSKFGHLKSERIDSHIRN